MQLTLPADGTVTLKGKNETVSLGASVSINNYTVPGMGEYDVAGIQCEAIVVGSTGLVYFLRLEDLQVTYLTEIAPDVSKLDDASNCNILVVDVRSNDSTDALKSIIKSLEPSYLVLREVSSIEAFQVALGLPAEKITTFKVTRSSLPLEGTTILYS